MTDRPDALTDLADRYGLPPAVVGPLRTLVELLAEPTAPTSVHDRDESVRIHVADSLVGLQIPEVRAATVLADLGAGAGLPGLVLAAALPGTRVVLVESVGRKCEFLRTAVAAMGLDRAEVVQARAEEWRDGLGRCDVVCARALAALPVLCEYAAPLLRAGGVLVAWKGTVDAAEAADGAAAAERVGLTPEAVVPVTPYRGSERRTLRVLRKTAPTPPEFPRRPGMATKRPLSATKAR